MILETNAHFNKPFEFDMSGIRIISEGENFRNQKVFRLIKDSPATRAGLKERDEIIRVDGCSVSGLLN